MRIIRSIFILHLLLFLTSCFYNKNYDLENVNSGKKLEPFIENYDLFLESVECQNMTNKLLKFRITHKEILDLSKYKLLILIDGKVLFKGDFNSNIELKLPICKSMEFKQYSVDIIMLDEVLDLYYYWSSKDVYSIFAKEANQIHIELLPKSDFDYENSVYYSIDID